MSLMTTSLNQLSVSDLRKAANLKEKIEALEKELSQLIGNGSVTVSASTGKASGKKGGMSASGKARIIAAQKARWAKFHAAKGGKPARKKHGMSAAGRAAIIAAQKARWAKVKAAKAGKK
jgi:hypothetical protein